MSSVLPSFPLSQFNRPGDDDRFVGLQTMGRESPDETLLGYLLAIDNPAGIQCHPFHGQPRFPYIAGSGPEGVQLRSTLPGVQPHHATFFRNDRGVLTVAPLTSSPIWVNGREIGQDSSAWVGHGMEVSLLRFNNGTFAATYRLILTRNVTPFGAIYTPLEDSAVCTLAAGNNSEPFYYRRTLVSAHRGVGTRVGTRFIVAQYKLSARLTNHVNIDCPLAVFITENDCHRVFATSFNLAQRIDQIVLNQYNQAVPIRVGVWWIIELLQGLNAVHISGTKHGAITTACIFIVNGHPVITDIGVEDVSPHPANPYWKAPEVAMALHNRPPARPMSVPADLFRLGMVVYLIVCGILPFGDEDEPQEEPGSQPWQDTRYDKATEEMFGASYIGHRAKVYGDLIADARQSDPVSQAEWTALHVNVKAGIIETIRGMLAFSPRLRMSLSDAIEELDVIALGAITIHDPATAPNDPDAMQL